MRYITPTGWGKSGGEPVRQLGSLRAVLEQLPRGAAVIVRSFGGEEVKAELEALGRPLDDVRVVSAGGGAMVLYELARQTVIGVAPDAYAHTLSEQWAEIQRVLTTRFETVHWG